jgi:hypothetical protein
MVGNKKKSLTEEQLRKYHRMFRARCNKSGWTETMALKFVLESIMQKTFHNGFVAGQKSVKDNEYQQWLDEN